jgi:ferredoxin
VELMSRATRRQRIAVDREICIGSGNCVFYAGETFDLDEDDRAIIVDPAGDDPDKHRMAVQSCPSGALSLVDENSRGQS